MELSKNVIKVLEKNRTEIREKILNFKIDKDMNWEKLHKLRKLDDAIAIILGKEEEEFKL